MKTLKALLTVGIVAVMALVVVGCGDDSTKTTTMTLTSKHDGRSISDIGPKGPSGSDVYSFSNEEMDESGKSVGDLEGFSVALPESGEGERRASTIQYTFSNGTIVASGVYEVDKRGAPNPKQEGVTNAITGGTGDYKDAGGEIKLTPTSDGQVKSVLTIETPK